MLPDPKYNSLEVSRFIKLMMYDGKKSTTRASFYRTMDIIGEQTKENPITVFKKALENPARMFVFNSEVSGVAILQSLHKTRNIGYRRREFCLFNKQVKMIRH